MDLLFRGTPLVAVIILTLWMKAFAVSVEASWHKAQELRWSLLADPSATYAAICHHPDSLNVPNTAGLCGVEIFRKSTSHGWIPLCADAFTLASRWYEIRLHCRLPHGLPTPISAKTRFWR